MPKAAEGPIAFFIVSLVTSLLIAALYLEFIFDIILSLIYLTPIILPLIFISLVLIIFYYRRSILRYYRLFETRVRNFLKKPLGHTQNWFTKERSIVLFVFLFVFVFYFWTQWVYNKQFVVAGMLHIVVHPFNFILQEGFIQAFSYRFFQVNSYTGNPFFLLPFVYALGYTPDAFRIILLGVLSAVPAVFFILYYKVLDLNKAILGVLILTSMSTWVFYWWPDYDYATLFFGILLLLYVTWLDSGAEADSYILYIMSCLGGLFFYFKATVLYMLISIGVAAMYEKRSEFLEFVKGLNIPVLVVLFLVGVSPFFMYSFLNIDTLAADGFSFGGMEEMSVTDIAAERYHQLDIWLDSEFTDLIGISDSGDRGKEIIDYETVHLFSALLFLSIITLIATRKYVSWVIIFLVFYILHFLLPFRTDVSRHQMVVFVPLVPLIVMSAWDVLTRSFEKTKIYRAIYMLMCLVFAVPIVFNIAAPDQADNPENEDEIPFHGWAGDQNYYSDFDKLGISETVLTNSYKAHSITKYFLDIPTSDLILPKELREKTVSELRQLPETGGRFNIGSYYGAKFDEPKKHGSINRSEPVTFVLRQKLPCKPEDEICGASLEAVIDEFNLDRDEAEQVELSGKSYLIFRNVTVW